jgi:hypothetical protein
LANTSQTIVLETTDTLELGGHTTKGPVLQRVVNLLNGLRAGTKRGVSMQVQYGGAALLPAVAHISLVSWATNQVIDINGALFTSTAAAAVAGNDEVLNTGSDAADAALLSTCINASTQAGVYGLVKAVNPLKDILTPASTRAGNFTVTLADGTVHTFIATNAAVTLGQATFDYRTSVALTTASIAAQVAAYAPFANKIAAVDGTTVATFRSLDGNTFTLAGTATVMAESGGNTVTVSALQKGGLGNALSVKTLGLVATTTATCATVVATNTLVVNGVEFLALQQRATGTITAAAVVAGNTCSIGGNTFTAQAAASTLGSAHFTLGAGGSADTDSATSLAAQINAFAPLSGVVTATSVLGVVTVRAVTSGTAGNAILLTGTAITLAAGAANLAGGIAVANNEFDVSPGSTNTQVATDLARAINASTSTLARNYVRASSRAAVVHLWSKVAGLPGNGITASSTGGTITVAAARLAGATTLSYEGAQAEGTLTLTSWLNTETVAVNGVTITAHTNTQANNQASIAGTNDEDAAALALAINNSTTAALADVIATAATNVVTVKSRRGGPDGNLITLASGQASVVANVARLAGGAVPTTVVISSNSSPNTTSGATKMAGGTGGAGTFVSVTL